jgi:hypothetical protein
MKRMIEARPVTPEEITVLRWLLENAPVGDIAGYRDQKLEDLHVVGGCDCGCVSAFFESDAGIRLEMIADAIAAYPDGEQSNLILWGRAGRIAWLEVCDVGPKSAHRMPAIENLRRWEQYFDTDSPA